MALASRRSPPIDLTGYLQISLTRPIVIACSLLLRSRSRWTGVRRGLATRYRFGANPRPFRSEGRFLCRAHVVRRAKGSRLLQSVSHGVPDRRAPPASPDPAQRNAHDEAPPLPRLFPRRVGGERRRSR